VVSFWQQMTDVRDRMTEGRCQSKDDGDRMTEVWEHISLNSEVGPAVVR